MIFFIILFHVCKKVYAGGCLIAKIFDIINVHVGERREKEVGEKDKERNKA